MEGKTGTFGTVLTTELFGTSRDTEIKDPINIFFMTEDERMEYWNE